MEHGKRKHAVLSASAAHRWMACPPSPRLEEEFPEGGSSFYAKEGTLAHELAELELLKAIGWISNDKYKKEYKAIENSEYYSDEMDDEVDKYVSYVMEQFVEAKRRTPNPLIQIEERVDLRQYIPEGFGTNDSTIIADKILEVIDLKYGKGVKVNAEENPQIMLYGLGSYYKNELLYDIDRVRFTIVQPRLDHISTWVMTVEDLVDWGENEVVPKAQLAFEGEGELNPGDHCRWCRAKPRCRAYAKMNLEAAKHEFKNPELLDDEEVIEMYELSSQLSDWAKSVGDYMLSEALQGKTWDGYKVVEGRSYRRWGDPDGAIQKLLDRDFEEDDVINKKIKGIGAIEKLVGKKEFPSLFEKEVIKPQGKPTLAPEDDKRPAMGLEQAKEDFKT